MFPNFTPRQLDLLFIRLRQTREELLYDATAGKSRKYLLTQTGSPILGVAHCDYIERAWSYPTYYAGNTKVRAGQVDDRVGVWLLLDVLPEIEDMPPFDVLLTDDEETGNSTAQDVDEDLIYNWTFQFDRRGTDWVDYDMASKRFRKAFNASTGIPEGMGTFSDICYLPDSCGSRCNIGTGYHNEHSPDAHVNLIECADQARAFVRFASEFANRKFPVPTAPKSTSFGYTSRTIEQSWFADIPRKTSARLRTPKYNRPSGNTQGLIAGQPALPSQSGPLEGYGRNSEEFSGGWSLPDTDDLIDPLELEITDDEREAMEQHWLSIFNTQ